MVGLGSSQCIDPVVWARCHYIMLNKYGSAFGCFDQGVIHISVLEIPAVVELIIIFHRKTIFFQGSLQTTHRYHVIKAVTAGQYPYIEQLAPGRA